MQKRYWFFFFLCCSPQLIIAQTTLNADGAGNTYELINSILAPGYNVVEVPDCNHSSFGRHIDEVFDTDLNQYVFRFHIHTSPDNDRCINFDRQRNEIKAYDKSPDSLLAVQYEKVEYKWKFKLDSSFQPSSSFTHLHQIKAVGGTESSMPLITLTARKSSPDRLELRFAQTTSQVTLAQTDLAPLKGVWLQATETILYDEIGLGEYEVLITKVAGGDTLFSYKNNAIRMWKTGASFLRPKWGIYRSLNDVSSLRDEEVFFADFSIEELNPLASSLSSTPNNKEILLFPNPVKEQLFLSEAALDKYNIVNIYNTNGQLILSEKIKNKPINTTNLNTGIYLVELKTKEGASNVVKIVVE